MAAKGHGGRPLCKLDSAEWLCLKAESPSEHLDWDAPRQVGFVTRLHKQHGFRVALDSYGALDAQPLREKNYWVHIITKVAFR